MEADRTDEAGQMAHHFNRLMEKLHQSMSHITRVNKELRDSSQVLNQASRGNMSLAQQQEAALDQVVTAVEELHGSAREVANNAEHLVSISDYLKENTRHSQEIDQAADQLVEQSSQVQTVLSGYRLS